MRSNDGDWGFAGSLATGGFLACALIAAYGLVTLPNSIPVHWGADGVGYGSKYTILILPAVGAMVMAVLRLSASAPTSMFNVPVRITPENEEAVRATVRSLLASIAAVLGIGFALLEMSIVVAAKSATFPVLIPFAALGLTAATLAVVARYFVRFRRLG